MMRALVSYVMVGLTRFECDRCGHQEEDLR